MPEVGLRVKIKADASELKKELEKAIGTFETAFAQPKLRKWEKDVIEEMQEMNKRSGIMNQLLGLGVGVGVVGILIKGFKEVRGTLEDLLGKPMQGVFEVLSKTLQIFFLPFSIFLASLLMPVAVWLLKVVMWMNKNMPEVLIILGAILTTLIALKAIEIGRGVIGAITGGGGVAGVAAGALGAGALAKVTTTIVSAISAGFAGLGVLAKFLGPPAAAAAIGGAIAYEEATKGKEAIEGLIPAMEDLERVLAEFKAEPIRDKWFKLIDAIRTFNKEFEANWDQIKQTAGAPMEDILGIVGADEFRKRKEAIDSFVATTLVDASTTMGQWADQFRITDEEAQAMADDVIPAVQQVAEQMMGLTGNLFGTVETTENLGKTWFENFLKMRTSTQESSTQVKTSIMTNILEPVRQAIAEVRILKQEMAGLGGAPGGIMGRVTGFVKQQVNDIFNVDVGREARF